MCLVQDSSFTQHVLELSGGECIIHLVLSSQDDLFDNVEMNAFLGSCDHNQINLKVPPQFDFR